MEEFSSPYNPKKTEDKIYRLWPACIAMPAAMTAVRLSGWRSIAGNQIITVTYV